MSQYLLRLDDASEYMDSEKWLKMERLLDKYSVKPLFGIIPNNQDPNLLKYGKVKDFWSIVKRWIDKGWTPALHGYTHVFETEEGGINPVNKKSEFAGVDYERQVQKIADGVKLLAGHGIYPKVFFAPAHTFDDNTIKALMEVSKIRIISDTPAFKPYCKNGITIVPQQSGRVRKLNFNTVTFCYHPNTTTERDFEVLEDFLKSNSFDNFPLVRTKRPLGLVDMILMKIYYWRHKK